MTEKQRKVCMYLLSLFKIDGKPASEVATEGQIEIFFELLFRPHKRLEILCSTQYGKSLFVALACIIITCIQKEIVAVVAPTNDKAKIIMRYFIEHLGDHEIFSVQLEKNTRLERLRMEESKERIILRNGGGIFIISVQAGNSKRGVEAAMGAGAKILIMDEAGLIPDSIESTVFRMIAGKGPDAFYCKIGNPFYRNHFFKSSQDVRYHQVFIDFNRGLVEGRYTQDFIDEAQSKPLFDILYGCKFPDPEAIDAGGFSPIFTEEYLNARKRNEVDLFGDEVFGCDVAGEGSNQSVITLRAHNGARVLYREHNPDTMNFASVILKFYNELGPTKIYIDKVGIGKPVYDRLKEFPDLEGKVIGVMAGEQATDTENFFNKRAEMFWRMKEWLGTSELEDKKEWGDLLDIRYKVQSDKKIKIKSKDEMLKEGVQSPDVADSLSLTFYHGLKAVTGITQYRPKWISKRK